MAGGYINFGPTYNSTKFVRLGYEGILGSKTLSAALVNDATNNPDFALAGLIAAIDDNGNLELANGSNTPIGLFREDLGDMMNASGMGTYYFGFGEYYVSAERFNQVYITTAKIGDKLGFDTNGQMTLLGNSTAGMQDVSGFGVTSKGVGVVTFGPGEYDQGNMYQWAGVAANGGNFVGVLWQL